MPWLVGTFVDGLLTQLLPLEVGGDGDLEFRVPAGEVELVRFPWSPGVVVQDLPRQRVRVEAGETRTIEW